MGLNHNILGGEANRPDAPRTLNQLLYGDNTPQDTYHFGYKATGIRGLTHFTVFRTRTRLKTINLAKIQDFVSAHAGNPERKAVMIAIMNSMGHDSMPLVPVERYNELYTRWRRAMRNIPN